MRHVIRAARVSFFGLLLAAGSGVAWAESVAANTEPGSPSISGQQLAASAPAQSPTPKPNVRPATTKPQNGRILITPAADYTGFDYNTVKGVDLAGCQNACLADDKCRAFTFNAKAGWCFMKSDFGALTATPGATAGRVVQWPDFTPTLEKKRLAELSFLPSSFIDEARQLAGTIKKKYDPAGGSYAALREAGGVAHRAGNYDEAAEDFGKALAIADDNPGLWLDFAIASSGRKPENWSERQTAFTNITAAAINGYLRSDNPSNLADALGMMGTGFQLREIWKPSYRSYRASLKLVEDGRIRSAYEKVIGEHGFRITDHQVDADSASPRICLVFSDSLPVSRPDLVDFVTVDNGQGLSIEPSDHQICVDGVQHGGRYHIRVRGGLPALDGEVLDRPTELDVYVRDRAPFVGFAGNAYVLPAGKGASIPITSVNTSDAKATIYRIGDRGLAGQLGDSGQFLKQLDSYNASSIGDQAGEKVWEGHVAIASKLNENVTTAIPISEAVPAMKPGVYVITASAVGPKGDNEYDSKVATQWFVVTDLGLTSLSGHDGVHAIVRSLSTAKPVAGVKVRLVATDNDILGEAVTDADGHVRFDPGLARGTGGAAPRLFDVQNSDGDYAFLDLSRSAFDLSDRGVDGRPAPAPLDAFLTPERGIYRPGETMHLTALVRDPRANAVTGLPMTFVVERPDGVEYRRTTVNDSGAGGYTTDVPFEANAMRGSWQVSLYADPKGAALANTSILVEDFEPERLAFELSTDAKWISPTQPATVNVAAKYLYGATAPDLTLDGDIDLTPSTTIAAYPDYHFGLTDETVEPVREPLDVSATTDADGKASVDIALPELPVSTRPFNAKIILRLTDTNGRAIERNLSLPVKSAADYVGIKPLFQGGEVDENTTARFEVIEVGADGARVAGTGLTWKLERLDSDYQWYNSNGNWNYELITTPRRIDGGTVDVAADLPATIAGKVEYGDYRLTVQTNGDVASATSYDFYAGWYSPGATSETPDVLTVSLDKPNYHVGDTAKVRLQPRFAGTAMIAVIDDRLITMKAVEVPAEGTTIDLPVTSDWGPGAYITASLYRPMDLDAKRMPARALGLAWAKVAPGDRQLNVSLDLPNEMRPRGPMNIPVTLANLKPGTDAYVTVAAVDVGILNLTNFKAPAPDEWYFGQRRLGMEIRDLYGLLIDRMQGVPGALRSGGDSGAVRLSAPPPTEKLLAFYSGIVKVGPDGKATVSFDIPDFNGTVRVMAMAWSGDAVGHATKDVIVHDPVVIAASIPRFLTTGDKSRLLVEINNLSGPAGEYQLTVAAGDGIGFPAEDATRKVTLAEKQRISFNIPIEGKAVGDFDVTVSLATPGGEQWPKTLTLGVRPPGGPVTRRNVVALAGDGKLTVDANALGEFFPGTTSVSVSVGGASRLDVAGILNALDRYPYGCVEQLTSRALPLVYLDDVAKTIGIASGKDVRERVKVAIDGVLADQDAAGSFGLWGPYNTGDLWLDSYVTDFLTRASEKGYDVPKVAREIALDNLANKINYAEDFTNGGEDVAYALYVLARAGRAAIGDLRYYAETKIGNFRTPLAKAQIGAALALYGDRARSGRAFNAAMADLKAEQEPWAVWRVDYGTLLRDQAAILTLAAESKSEAVDLRDLATKIAAIEENRRYTSTQENAWMLLAANALIRDAAANTSFSVNGATITGPVFRRFNGDRLATAPVVIQNLGAQTLDAVVSTTGVPLTPEPEGGDGFKIERHYYSVNGDEMDIANVPQNQRVVVELTVTATEGRRGKVLVVDPIPAGYEIENPDISASGDTSLFDWLDVERSVHTEARTDRFIAALDRSDSDPLQYSVAYSMRAVSPGVYAQPGATVEDMYRPGLVARTATGTVEVVGPTK